VQSLPRKGQDFAVERSGLVREELDPDALRIGSLEAEVREREMSWGGSTSTSMDSASRGISTGEGGEGEAETSGAEGARSPRGICQVAGTCSA